MIRKPAPEQSVFIRRRMEAVAGLMALGVALLAIRAIDLQWYQADELKAKAERQRFKQYSTLAPRGAILDRKGRTLAESIEVPSIAAIAPEVPQDRIAELAKALRIKKSTLTKKLKEKDGFVWLARQVTPDTSDRVMALNIPGVRSEMEWRRYHPLGPELGHVLGFVGIDGDGLEGLEHSMNNVLQGEAGIKQVQRDARGVSLPGGVWLKQPTVGQSIELHIDATIQSIAYAALSEGVRQHGAKGGSVVIMDPNNGAVLAMANWPGFNPNDFRNYRPSMWRNRAVTDVFEPGSALKPFTVAAALASGRWQKKSLIFCENGSLQVGDYIIHDDHPEGWLDLTGLLAKSSNIGAAKIALDVGGNSLYNMLTRVGINKRTGIDLNGESPGLLPPIERWGPVETANIAFGQGVAVTPLQLATAFSILANGGMKVSPKLLKNQEHDTPVRVMPAEIAKTVLRMLERAVGPDGTGAKAVPAGYRVAGKTGTAQKPDAKGGYSNQYTAVFAGTVPADNPQLVIVVVIDEPQDSIYGGSVAAPVFRNISEAALPYLGIAPETTAPANSKPWQLVKATSDKKAALAPEGSVPSLFGLSLREARIRLADNGYVLLAHGSGWVEKQKPTASSRLATGDTVEVWLDE